MNEENGKMNVVKRKGYLIEVVLWSIAFPGFGQLMNGKMVKGILFILLELLINMNAYLNLIIKYSFTGEFEKAIAVSNNQWALFYPCVFAFAIFDSYVDGIKMTGKEPAPYIGIPFVMAAYFSTVGVIYGDVKPFYLIVPPIFIPIILLILGFLIGMLIRKWILYTVN